MADYAVFYSDSTGYILGSWVRATSDNISTFEADEKITVDGVDVVVGLVGSSRTDLAMILLTDPTAIDVEAPLMTHEVDAAGAPTDCDERTDGGKNPDYDYTA